MDLMIGGLIVSAMGFGAIGVAWLVRHWMDKRMSRFNLPIGPNEEENDQFPDVGD